MPVERRGQAIHARSVRSTGNRRNCSVVAERASALLNGKSRVSREAQARFSEGLGVKLPRATRPSTENRPNRKSVNAIRRQGRSNPAMPVAGLVEDKESTLHREK